MRKTQLSILFTAIFLFCSTFLFDVFGQFSIGVSGGINYATNRFVDLDLIAPSRTIFYFAGITPEYQLNSKMSILTDIQFSQKGYADTTSLYPQKAKYRFTYLDFLPQVEYRILDHIGIGVGCNLGIKLKEDLKSGDMDWQDPYLVELTKSFDFGLVGSIKGHFKDFSLFIRYNYGLKDISNLVFTDINGNEEIDLNQHNNNIQIGAGYTFAL
ncbi:MAG TPA: porin family protein [Saprospiraceae bacterium]|nr:porin family protein [Saprospiraceae bacterium]